MEYQKGKLMLETNLCRVERSMSPKVIYDKEESTSKSIIKMRLEKNVNIGTYLFNFCTFLEESKA